MKIAIISGPRAISTQDEQLVRDVTREIISRGFTIYVGDAAGVDAIVRELVWNFSPHKFFSPRLGRTPAGLAERSTRMVKAALADGDEIICVGFPNRECPDGIVPARTWRSGGSGTWSTLALAVGHEIETWIFGYAGEMRNEWLLFWEKSTFSERMAWHFTPLLFQFPDVAHEALALGYTELAR